MGIGVGVNHLTDSIDCGEYSVTGGEVGGPNPKSAIFLEIPFVLIGMSWAVALGATDGLTALATALLVAVASFGVGYLLIWWLYRLARRRIEADIKPRRWEYWLERQGPWILPAAVGFGMWFSRFGENDYLGPALGVGAFLLVAGIAHALAFLEPPTVPKSTLPEAHGSQGPVRRDP